VREFTMKDSYSLDVDDAGLDAQYRAHYQAYYNIFARAGLPVTAVNSDVGMMGGTAAHEFMFLTPIGEDTLVICPQCGYAANRQIAPATRPLVDHGPPEPLAEVATPNTPTIAALAEFLGIPASQTGKAVFFIARRPGAGSEPEDRLVTAVVRGDTEVNETKLTNLLQASALRPASDAEIEAGGMAPGYASPIGIDPARAVVVADRLVAESHNLVVGANRPGYHLRNANHGRDYTAALVGDIVAASAGDPCPACGEPVALERGVEVGNIFKLGTKYSAALGANVLGPDGVQRPIVMGSYGIGVGRVLACVVEHSHDEHGIIWPASVAPYDVHLVSLGENEAAAELYAELQRGGLSVIYDDRGESAGVKFADADLLGMPIRVTLSRRTLAAGEVEIKLRSATERTLVPRAEAVEQVQRLRQALLDAIQATVVTVPYR
jgi:prolyl-tRNA synthetase